MSYLEAESDKQTLSTDELVQYATAAIAPSDPQSYKDAMKQEDAHLWQKAVADKLKAMDDNSVWVEAELPAGRMAIRTKWVLKVKQKSDGTVERYKACLVAQGFAQKPHLDYTETFAPVAKFGSIRAILAIAAIEDMEIHLLDVSNAFLNGELEEEIYILPPEGSALTGKVLCLCKSLYGLKQSPCAWYNHLDATFKSMGFRQCPSDNSVWVWAKDKSRIIIPVFVDDITIVSKDKDEIKRVKSVLMAKYKIRDLGPIEFLLGIKVIRDRPKRMLWLSQRKMAMDVC